MAESKTVLVIDDSSSIRRLVDSTLTREGYSVLLAGDAETGVQSALSNLPDVILLDHQLPGTTGLEVCRQLMNEPAVSEIPVVISSTLRKKAYFEYGEMNNVVDMLPKPYSEELLLTTISNALETGGLVVESQSHGTAVPELIDAQSESDLVGTFEHFTIREVIDFLNNGQKSGTLGIESARKRYSIHLRDGRVVGMTATGVSANEVANRLPKSLDELAAVVNVTMGRGGAALESIVDLLNSEVLDPRLLRRLLRHQAAVLLLDCFCEDLQSFRFSQNAKLPALFQRLPLNLSVLALLVEGASSRTTEEIPPASAKARFSRQPIRGQNLDRAGLSAKQALLLRHISNPHTLGELATVVGDQSGEVRKWLYGLELADLVHCEDAQLASSPGVVIYESEAGLANEIKQAFARQDRYKLTVVNDPVAAGLLVRRTGPSIVIVDATDPRIFSALRKTSADLGTKWIATGLGEIAEADLTVRRPFQCATLLEALDKVAPPADPSLGKNNHLEETELCKT